MAWSQIKKHIKAVNIKASEIWYKSKYHKSENQVCKSEIIEIVNEKEIHWSGSINKSVLW